MLTAGGVGEANQHRPPKSALYVSLIVCTRNRAERLPDLLACLASLEPPPAGWELLLVDNASTDATPHVLHQFASAASFRVVCLHAAVPGLSRARNVGLAHARGDVLAFTDDDCYPRRDYLRALVAAFEEQDHHGFVGGRLVLHDPRDARISVKDVDTTIDIAPRTFVPAGVIHGANMALRREVVRAIGGFDPLLGAGSACAAGEDTDYIARAAWAGWGGCYDPRPVVAHHHRRKPGPDADRQRRLYDYGRGACYAKHLLNPESRRAYLSGWYWLARHHLRTDRVGRLRRELVGGARYVVMRSLGKPDPNLDRHRWWRGDATQPRQQQTAARRP